MDDALDGALSTVVDFVPKLLLFIVILVVGVIVAKVLAKVVDKVLERVGFDRAIERGGVGRALERSKFDASDVLAKLVYYFVLLFTLQLAFSVWGPNPISDLLTSIIGFLPQIFVAIVIVVVAAAIAAGVKTLVEGTLGGLSYGRLLANIASVFILGLGVIAALNQVGIATTVTTPVLIAVLATIAGILVVGVGGGLVRPMQGRWEQYLSRAEQEAPRMREAAAQSPSATTQVQQRVADAGYGRHGSDSAYDQHGVDAGNGRSTAGHGQSSTGYDQPTQAYEQSTPLYGEATRPRSADQGYSGS
ncbi:MAG: mechanosensitive ion channel family protein [Phycicoccus sp.]